jgi:hypothetical protein
MGYRVVQTERGRRWPVIQNGQVIQVGFFRPFKDQSVKVIFLRSVYGSALVGTLKAALAEARDQARSNGQAASVGGWLPQHRVWFSSGGSGRWSGTV